MSLTLAEYADSLDERDLIWPSVPPPKPVKAVPKVRPLEDIRAVLWDVYGTLLRCPEGRLVLQTEGRDEVRMQIALDKTIHEFHMWNSMFRKPGPPWQSMIGQFRNLHDRLAMTSSGRKGDFVSVSLAAIWEAVIDRLFDKEYRYESEMYGDTDEYAQKVAYYYHSCLQATEARAGAAAVMSELAEADIRQGLLADSQCFTLVQLLRAVCRQGRIPPVHELFRRETLLLSHQIGLRKPSRSLYEQAVSSMRLLGIEPEQILHVSCRLGTDLAPAKAVGMRTALLAAEKVGLEADSEMLKDPSTRPDRLLTELSQVSELVGFG